MLDATPEHLVTTTGFDVGCHACWAPRVHIHAGHLEQYVAMHHLPVLLVVHLRYRGRPQAWICARPRPLTR